MAGLVNGERIVLQEYLDANANARIDAGDLLVQHLGLTDGKATVIGGVTNLNLPGDLNPAAGIITVQLNLQTSGSMQHLVANYGFKLSSPMGRFTPATNFLSVTNFPYSQSFTGSVRSSGAAVPNACVMVFEPMPNFKPVAGTVANNSGYYSIKVPPGTYLLWAAKSNYVADLASAPVLTITNGTTRSTNLSLLATTRNIGGKLLDAADASVGLPCVFLAFTSSNNQIATGFSDTNGNYTVRGTASEWRMMWDRASFNSLGYLVPVDPPTANTAAGNVTGLNVLFPKGTALIYGTITDDQSHPLSGVTFGDATDGTYRADATTDENGTFIMAVTEGIWECYVDAAYSGYFNHVFSSQARGAIDVLNGQAVRNNFVGVLATNPVVGHVRDFQHRPVTNLGVTASAIINDMECGVNGALTDVNGDFSFNAGRGTWNVNLFCEGDSGLNALGYRCVDDQPVCISNNIPVVNFVVYPLWVPFVNRPAKLSSNQISFDFSGSVGTNYTVQFSTNLTSPNWFNLCFTNLSTNACIIRDSQATNPMRFYRVKVGP